MLVKYNSLSPAGSISSRSSLLYQLLQQINAKYSRVVLHWAVAAVWTSPPKIRYKPVGVRFVLVFGVEFQDLYVLFSCTGRFHAFWLVLKNVSRSWSQCLCVCHWPLLLWGMFWPNDLFQWRFSECRLFQRHCKVHKTGWLGRGGELPAAQANGYEEEPW